MLLDAWSLDFKPNDYTFLHDSRIFPIIRSLMARGPASSPVGSPRVTAGSTPRTIVTSPRGTVHEESKEKPAAAKFSALDPPSSESDAKSNDEATDSSASDTPASLISLGPGEDIGRLSDSVLESLVYTIGREKVCTEECVFVSIAFCFLSAHSRFV